jgi:glycosyltransferase involved in cell wall biosynthesis
LTSIAFTRSGLTIFTLFNLSIKAMILARQTYKLRKNYDVFHAHDLISAMVFLLLARGNDVTLLNAHFFVEPWEEFVVGGYIKRNDVTYHILKYIFLKTLNSMNLRFMAVSQRNSNLISEMVPNQKMPSIVLYPGIESTMLSSPILNDTPYLINVGSLDKRKNQIWLIDILSELEKLGIICPLVLVGPEDAVEKERLLKRIDHLKIQSPVHLLGKRNPIETKRLIQSALIYIHASKSESFGRTLVEAMSTKTTVVACDYDAVHEILDDNAILKSDWTQVETATFLKTLIENEALRGSLQKTQYRKYLQAFTGEQMILTYTNTLEGAWRIL